MAGLEYLQAMVDGELPPAPIGALMQFDITTSGFRVGFTEGIVTDASGAVVATASSALLVFDL